MNIFHLSNDPAEAATFHCNKHVVKMILETAQLLSTAHRVSGYVGDGCYKSTHVNHPSSIWTRASTENYKWLFQLFLELGKEKNYRFGGDHSSLRLAEFLRNPPEKLPNIGLTPFAQAMPEQYKRDDPVEAYRAYYIGEKTRMAYWGNRGMPLWYGLEVWAKNDIPHFYIEQSTDTIKTKFKKIDPWYSKSLNKSLQKNKKEL